MAETKIDWCDYSLNPVKMIRSISVYRMRNSYCAVSIWIDKIA